MDFKNYLDSVSSAINRARSIIYFIFVVAFGFYTFYRASLMPDWTDVRLSRLQYAVQCWDYPPKNGPNECESSKNYAREWLLPHNAAAAKEPLDKINDHELKRELQHLIDKYVEQRADNWQAKVPFFGYVIDTNDMPLIGGLLQCLLFFLLVKSLSAVTINTQRSIDKAIRDKSLDELELLAMCQMLSIDERLPVSQALMPILLALPCVFEAWVVYYHWAGRPAYGRLTTPWYATRTAIQLDLLLLVLVVLTIAAIMRWNKHLGQIRAIEAKLTQGFDLS